MPTAHHEEADATDLLACRGAAALFPSVRGYVPVVPAALACHWIDLALCGPNELLAMVGIVRLEARWQAGATAARVNKNARRFRSSDQIGASIEGTERVRKAIEPRKTLNRPHSYIYTKLTGGNTGSIDGPGVGPARSQQPNGPSVSNPVDRRRPSSAAQREQQRRQQSPSIPSCRWTSTSSRRTWIARRGGF